MFLFGIIDIGQCRAGLTSWITSYGGLLHIKHSGTFRCQLFFLKQPELTQLFPKIIFLWFHHTGTKVLEMLLKYKISAIGGVSPSTILMVWNWI